MASAGHDWKVKFWDVATGINVGTLVSVVPSILAFSPDGKRLLTDSELWDLKTKKVIKNFNRAPWKPAFDSKGKLLAFSAGYWPEPPDI